MPLPSPILDDRSYRQLRDELVRRIPVYTPEWTDHNASDPGITLIELFAFLGENLLFRFNQIPEATKLAFLRLLQIPLQPATPARAVITMSAEASTGTLVPIGSEARAGSLQHETLTEVVAWPVSFVGAVRVETAAPDQTSQPDVFEFAVRTLDAVHLTPDQQPAYYETQTIPPDVTGLPVDAGAAVDGMIWVAVLSGKSVDMTQMGGAAINVGFIPDPVAPSIDQVSACPGAGATAGTNAVQWQASTGTLDAQGQPVYAPLTVIGDTTRGLAQEGVVRLRLPNNPAVPANPTGLGVYTFADPDVQGSGQFPPVLDDQTEAKILFWMRVFRLNGSRFAKVQFVGANAAEVAQTIKAPPELVGVGNGQPNQKFKLIHTPVMDGSLVLEAEDLAGLGNFKPWTEMDGFFASGPEDRHFILDPEAGQIQFGSGIQGFAPQIGQRIRATEYRYGGGAAGNVPPKAISKISGFSVKDVQNPLRAHSGSDSETIEDALTRIPGELRRRDRAVTAGDFRELALETPGAGVGRAECLPRFYPPTRTPERAGVVSVVVWPKEDAKHPNAPLPDASLLRYVCAWLDARRLVTTELYVIPPTYRKVAVAVGLEVKPGFGVEAVRQWTELVLRQYLAPLPPYGPTGEGWPLGRRVYGPELEAAAIQVEGVEFLNGLTVAGLDASGNWVAGPVDLTPYEVPELAAITVVQGQPADVGKILPPPLGKTPIPIPIIREVC
jgi:predicted phage baseplate assembly protein